MKINCEMNDNTDLAISVNVRAMKNILLHHSRPTKQHETITVEPISQSYKCRHAANRQYHEIIIFKRTYHTYEIQ